MGVGILTNVGLTEMLTHQAADASFGFAHAQISSDVVAVTADLTSLPDIVFVADSSMISQVVIDPNTIRTILYLDTSVGDFTIGTIGLYTDAGTLFAVAEFPGAGTKLRNNPPSQAGNIRTFYIDIVYDDIASIPGINQPGVTMRQLRTALNDMGLLGAAQSAVLAAEYTTQASINWFSCAQNNELGDPLFVFLSTALALGDGGTALFAAANAIVPR